MNKKTHGPQIDKWDLKETISIIHNWKYFFRKEEDKLITHHVTTTKVNVFIPKLHVVLKKIIKHKEQNPSHNHICTMKRKTHLLHSTYICKGENFDFCKQYIV